MNTSQENALLAKKFVDRGLPMASDVWFSGSILPGLDYSVQSLVAVDAYLGSLRGKVMPENSGAPVGEPEPNWALLFDADGADYAISAIAAYVGEVLRRNFDGDSAWLDFNELQARGGPEAEIANDESDIASWMNLVLGNSVTWPAAKVLKRIVDGEGDDLHAYALVLTQKR